MSSASAPGVSGEGEREPDIEEANEAMEPKRR